MELYLIRHTRPDISPGICYGQSDIGLAATFTSELETLKAKLGSIAPPAVIYSSPSQRCTQLAQALSGGLACDDIKEDSRLMELHFGDWELQSWDTISQKELEDWGKDYVTLAPPSGETFQQLQARVLHFLADIRSAASQTAFLITHAGVIRTLLAETMGIPMSQAFNIELNYGGITQLLCEKGRLRAGYVNA